MTESKVKAAADRIKVILDNGKKEEAEREALIQEEKKKAEAAEAMMADATLIGDVEAYKAAKEELRGIQDGLELQEKRMAILKKGALIGKADYEQTVKEITEEVKGKEKKIREQLARLSEEMAAAADEMQRIQTEANEVLSNLQKHVFRNMDRTKNDRTGEIIPLAYEEKRVDCLVTIDWARAGVHHYQYHQYNLDKAES